MKYKGYEAVVEYSEEDHLLVARVINTADVLVCDGRSVDELRRSFESLIDNYLDDCARARKPPAKPFSGKFMVRLPPELHARLYAEAARAHTSLNALLVQKLGG